MKLLMQRFLGVVILAVVLCALAFGGIRWVQWQQGKRADSKLDSLKSHTLVISQDDLGQLQVTEPMKLDRALVAKQQSFVLHAAQHPRVPPASSEIQKRPLASCVWVRLGLFVDRANADMMLSQTKTLPWSFQVKPATWQGRVYHGVFAGPFAGVREAKQMIVALAKRYHMQGVLVQEGV